MGLSARGQLTRKQQRFVEEYAHLGNATEAARRAGYRDTGAIHTTGWENLQKPAVISALAQRDEEIARQITPNRVRRRLHDLSYAAQEAGQFGPATRAEELLGKSLGMWVDQSIALTGQLNDTHINALLAIARQRQHQPVELQDDGSHNPSHSDDDEG